MNRLLLIFVVVVVFAAVMLAMQGWYWYRMTAKEKEESELSRRLGTASSELAETLFRVDLKGEAGPRSLGDIGGRISASLEDLLMQAGNPYTIQSLMGRMVIFALVGMVGTSVLFSPKAGLFGLIAAYLPVLLLRRAADNRAAELTEQLPEALELVSRSLQAGHAIAEAMRACGEEMHPPISFEFGLVYEQNNLGRDFRDCMTSLTARNPQSFDLKIFASSVLLQRETGGNLIEILEGIATVIRKRFVFKGKVKALTAEARFSAYILGGLPFFVAGAIYGLRPTYLDPLFEDPLGNMMLAFICVWFTLGVFVMREITKIEV